MSLSDGEELNVTNARWVSENTLEIEFSDGCLKSVDFKPFLAGSDHAEIRKYLDVERFKGFVISYGNLVWNDYDLCFSIEALYSGDLRAENKRDEMVAEGPAAYGADSTVD